jgi:hypothetical protein
MRGRSGAMAFVAFHLLKQASICSARLGAPPFASKAYSVRGEIKSSQAFALVLVAHGSFLGSGIEQHWGCSGSDERFGSL